MASQAAFDLACPGVSIPTSGTTTGTTAAPVTCDVALAAITGNQRCSALLADDATVTASDCTACRTLFETAAAACDLSMVCD